MAKLGESDQRWIVEARSDGKNVGNWHWSEKSVLNESLVKFKEVFQDVDVPCDGATLTLNEVTTITGDMNLMNRKGTIKFLYDSNVTFAWTGLVDGIEGKGTLEVYDVDNSNDYQYRVTMTDEKSENRVLKDLIKNNAPSVLNPMILDLMNSLTEEFTQRENNDDQPEQTETTSPVIQNFNSIVVPSGGDLAQKMTLTTVRQTVRFVASPSDIYQTLTDPQRIMAFTASPCSYEPTPGADFFLLDGAISGKVVKLEQDKKIVQKWRFNDWEEDHYSHLIIKIEGENGKTKVTLLQKKVPSSDSSRTLQGWENYFWRRIRGVFGWSYTILN